LTIKPTAKSLPDTVSMLGSVILSFLSILFKTPDLETIMTKTSKLDWQQQPLTDNKSLISAKITDEQIHLIHQAVLQTVDKAVEIIATNIKDNSRYFLAQWQPQLAILSLVLSDDKKSEDSAISTQLEIAAFKTQDAQSQIELSEEIQHWIQNYLTTHTGFMQFSLVAVYTDSSRQNCQLL
jgi:hypothetical protein